MSVYTLFWSGCAIVGLWRCESGLRDGRIGDPFSGTTDSRESPGYFTALIVVWLVFSIGCAIAAWMTTWA